MSFFERATRNNGQPYEAPPAQKYFEQDSPVPPPRGELKGSALLKVKKNRTASSANLLEDYDEDTHMVDHSLYVYPDAAHHAHEAPHHHDPHHPHPVHHRHHHHNACHPYQGGHHGHHHGNHHQPDEHTSSSSDSSDHHHHHHRERSHGEHNHHHHHHRHHNKEDAVMTTPTKKEEEVNNGSGSSSPSIQVVDAKQQEKLAEKLKTIAKLKSFNIDPYTGEKKLSAIDHTGYKKEHSPSPKRSSSASPKRREPEISPKTRRLFGWGS